MTRSEGANCTLARSVALPTSLIPAGYAILGAQDEGERVRVERLTFVHNGDQGSIGKLILESRGVLRFNTDGSGLIEIPTPAAAVAVGHGSAPAFGMEGATLRMMSVAFSALPEAVREELGEQQVPCILGHAGVTTITLLSPRSCARVSASMSDLRGKIRFALARVGWEL